MYTACIDLCVCINRSVVRKHEQLQRNLEKAEETLSAKAEAKDTLQQSVSIILHVQI